MQEYYYDTDNSAIADRFWMWLILNKINFANYYRKNETGDIFEFIIVCDEQHKKLIKSFIEYLEKLTQN